MWLDDIKFPLNRGCFHQLSRKCNQKLLLLLLWHALPWLPGRKRCWFIVTKALFQNGRGFTIQQKSLLYETPSEQNRKTTISKWCAADKNLTANRAASTRAAFPFLLYFYVFNVHSVSFPSGPACPSDLPLFPIWDSACYSSYFQSLWFQHSHPRLHSLKSLPFTSLTAISTLNSISGPPKKYVQTDGDPTAINTARRTRVHLCVRDSEHLLLSTSVASLHLVTLWSNLGKRRKTPRAAPPNEEYSARRMCKKPKIRIECFTSIVFDGEVVVVGNFWSKAECEVLPVAHLIFVHRRNRFNDLNHRCENIFTQKQEHPISSKFLLWRVNPTFPGMADSHMSTSLLVANSGGLSFTSLTLILTRTLVSWWWPPTRRHRS